MDASRFREITRQVMGLAGGSAVEIVLSAQEEGLTRFADNAVSQHVETADAALAVRVRRGRRQGRASCNQFDRATLERTVRRAETLAREMPEEPELLDYPGPQRYAPMPEEAPGPPPAPAVRVERLRRALAPCVRAKASSAGIFTTGTSATGVANSNGLFAHRRYGSAGISLTVLDGDGSGWAEATRRRIDELRPEELAAVALKKARSGRRPKELPPGAYDVVLEPAAVAELMLFMAWEGFGGLSYLEGRSFVSGKLGRKVLGENVTITDDVYHPLTLGLNFDYEGMPRRRVALVERGVAGAVVHDRATARRAGTESSGHALPLPNTHGPLPLNLCLAPGDASVGEMVAGTERGLLITHFHYTNILDPVTLLITGMTRDGVYRIEKGRIRHPVKNFRFTESVVGAFNRVEALGREAVYAHAFWGGGIVAPAVKIRGFNFSSGTKF